ncbi:FadR/GntR family transcriptional regulator [Paracoccus sp. (in: a-proteobacteria)]|uniref:FadR/GntR family transcriptional regulator n=1 Tax=Paracoccus sp. TaxID=267 RepID=UPI003A8BEDE1
MTRDADELSGVLAALEPVLTEAASQGSARLPPERALAERLGVPRRRLRLALDHLQRRGVIFRRHGQGTFIAPPPHPDRGRNRLLAGRTSPEQVMDVRLQIEPHLAQLAARFATAEDLEQLERLMRKTVEARSARDYDLADEVFHFRIAELAGNPLFQEIYDLIRDLRRDTGWRERREKTHSPQVISVLAEQHRRIFDAIASRDEAAAGAELRQHLDYVARRIRRPPASEG